MFQTSKHLPKNLPTRGAPFMSQHRWVETVLETQQEVITGTVIETKEIDLLEKSSEPGIVKAASGAT